MYGWNVYIHTKTFTEGTSLETIYELVCDTSLFMYWPNYSSSYNIWRRFDKVVSNNVMPRGMVPLRRKASDQRVLMTFSFKTLSDISTNKNFLMILFHQNIANVLYTTLKLIFFLAHKFFLSRASFIFLHFLIRCSIECIHSYAESYMSGLLWISQLKAKALRQRKSSKIKVCQRGWCIIMLTFGHVPEFHVFHWKRAIHPLTFLLTNAVH